MKRLPDDVGYYDAKMTGAAEASGEVVVFADSDCIYQPGWLRAMVEPFADPAIAVVGGETVIRGEGPYALALRLAFHFDGYSDRKDLYQSPKYYLNNVAFRREVLLRHPLPLDLPLFRGHCAKHAHLLQRQGIAIWRQPRARTTHEPPEGPRAFVWRFLLIGHDRALMQRMRGGAGGRLRTFGPRLASALKEKPTRALWLPAALPIAAAAMALVAAGSAITRRWPDYLLDRYNRQSDGTAVSTDDPARHTAT